MSRPHMTTLECETTHVSEKASHRLVKYHSYYGAGGLWTELSDTPLPWSRGGWVSGTHRAVLVRAGLGSVISSRSSASSPIQTLNPWPPTPGARPPPLLALMPGEPHLSRPLAKPGPSPGLAARGRCAFPRARALRLQRRLLPPRPALGLKAAETQSSVPADPGGRSELQEVRAVAPRGTLTCRLTWTPLRASSLPVATVLADQPRQQTKGPADRGFLLCRAGMRRPPPPCHFGVPVLVL